MLIIFACYADEFAYYFDVLNLESFLVLTFLLSLTKIYGEFENFLEVAEF